MAYGDFTFPQVLADFGLSLAEADLFTHVPPADVPAEFADRVRTDAVLALGINTEKARSEFIIAPILAQLWRGAADRFSLFSGVVFDVDAARGLTGFCDFILSRSPIQAVISAPVVTITEAKNDNTRNAYGQCVAGMVAARDFNAKSGESPAVYGVSTTGTGWRFLQLRGDALVLDRPEYQLAELPRIMGILTYILTAG